MDLDHDVQMDDVGDDATLGMTEDMQNSAFSNMSNIPRHTPGELTTQSLNQLDAWIETLSQCRPLTEDEVETLCNMVRYNIFIHSLFFCFFFFFIFWPLGI